MERHSSIGTGWPPLTLVERSAAETVPPKNWAASRSRLLRQGCDVAGRGRGGPHQNQIGARGYGEANKPGVIIQPPQRRNRQTEQRHGNARQHAPDGSRIHAAEVFVLASAEV